MAKTAKKKSAAKKSVKKPAATKPVATKPVKAPVKAKSAAKAKPAAKAPAPPARAQASTTPYMPKPIEGVGWQPFRYPLA